VAPEQRAENNEQRTMSREQRAENREQKTVPGTILSAKKTVPGTILGTILPAATLIFVNCSLLIVHC